MQRLIITLALLLLTFLDESAFCQTPRISMMDKLASPITLDRLDLIDEQRSEVKKLLEDFRAKVRVIVETGKGFDDRSQRFLYMSEAIREAGAESESGLGEVLLDHQLLALKQFTVADRFDREGMEGILTSDDLFPAIANLGLSDMDKDKLIANEKKATDAFRSELTKLQREYANKVRVLKEGYREDLLSPLSEQQKSVLKSVLPESIGN